MPKDLDAIIQFINQPNTDYAYMLTGNWGCGKTYFWKHVVVPRLRSSRPETEEVLIAYVSLYGIRRAEDLRNAVLAQLHPRIAKAGKLANVLGPALLRILRVELPKSEGFLDWCSSWWKGEDETRSVITLLMELHGRGKKLVLCFDDLERASLPIEVALGQINQFVEHAGAKVIILCNEREIRADKKNVYRKTKEKVVRITRTFSGDPTHVLSASIAEFAGDRHYHKFLADNLDVIKGILRRSELKNLRDLKYALLILQSAFKELKKLLPQEDGVHRQYLETLLPVSFDLQSRRLNLRDARAFLMQGNGAVFGAFMGKDEEDELKPLAAFGNRYGFGGLDNDIPKSEALADLIETGYLDPAKLKAEIDERNSQQSPGQQAVSALLGAWYLIPDESIPGVVVQALASISRGEIRKPEQLHSLANTLDWMKGEGVEGLQDHAAQRAFEEGITKHTTEWAVPERDLMFLEHSLTMGNNETALGKHVRELIVKTEASFQDKKLRETFQAAFDAVASDPGRVSFLLCDDQGKGIGRRPIAAFLAPDALSDALFAGSNEVRDALGGGLRFRYSDQLKVKALADDLPWLQGFLDILNRHLANPNAATPAGNLHLRRIKGSVEASIKRIEESALPVPQAIPAGGN
jgi:hypothetical protein